MAALTISFIVGVIGNIISILVFLSPITTFRGIVKKKATENFKGIPYICTLLITVNGAGAVLQVIYVTLFIIYAPRDSKIKHLKLAGIVNVGFYGAVLLITLLATHGGLRLTVVGFICAGFTLGMYGAPLGVMVPNAIGFVLGSVQLIMYITYNNISKSKKLSMEKLEEEGVGESTNYVTEKKILSSKKCC
ncbi:hypothetical protein C5167_011946 [Papaver somniferum]|uniref:Bidirectional sugar transporter SWEET n=1 Tax=Papaver somniferum TaxID=3469 RepID=A0A4Y7IW27_PAPSO|nr:hypothetical protein C5167_011946 [Papaver somniferum]